MYVGLVSELEQVAASGRGGGHVGSLGVYQLREMFVRYINNSLQVEKRFREKRFCSGLGVVLNTFRTLSQRLSTTREVFSRLWDFAQARARGRIL